MMRYVPTDSVKISLPYTVSIIFYDKYCKYNNVNDYDKNLPGVQTFYDNRYEGYPPIPSYLRDSILEDMPINFRKRSNLPYEFIRDKGIAGGRETYDTAFQDVPVRTDNIPAEAFDSRSYLLPEAMSIVPQQFKDGGSVNTYDVLKLINDTMNDG